MTKYETQRDAANAIAEAQGWTAKEDWSEFWASECQFWFEGDRKVVECDTYQPLNEKAVLTRITRHNLGIKPVFRMLNGDTVRFWQVRSCHGAYQKTFQSAELWDALAQWLVGYYEFSTILKQKVDTV